jgi:hypothetical protein
MRSAHRSLLIAPLAAAAVSCGLGDMVKDMVHVERCIAQRSGTRSMNVNLGATKRLTIQLVNAPIDTLPAEARAAAARQVAECVRDNYRRFSSLDEITVGFTRRASAGPVKVSTTGTSFDFKTKDLGQPAAPGADSTAGRAPTPN